MDGDGDGTSFRREVGENERSHAGWDFRWLIFGEWMSNFILPWVRKEAET